MNGILLVNKEPGWTSNDCVVKLKGVLHERRIGHAGTLDPMAEGLLVIFAGRATRAVSFAESQIKTYVAGFRPGIVTDTYDITGHVLSSSEPCFTEQEFADAVNSFLGPQLQVPPMYSAIKINGEKLYDLARKGVNIERAPREITVYSIELLNKCDNDRYLNIVCSKGTYIRSLCHDLGEKLGCGGCMSYLKRTSVGSMKCEDAHTIAEISEYMKSGSISDILMPVDTVFMDYPEYIASEPEYNRIKCGNSFVCGIPEGKYRVYSQDREFLMLGKVEDGQMKTVKSFFVV